jgi:hypothetical protein
VRLFAHVSARIDQGASGVTQLVDQHHADVVRGDRVRAGDLDALDVDPLLLAVEHHQAATNGLDHPRVVRHRDGAQLATELHPAFAGLCDQRHLDPGQRALERVLVVERAARDRVGAPLQFARDRQVIVADHDITRASACTGRRFAGRIEVVQMQVGHGPTITPSKPAND